MKNPATAELKRSLPDKCDMNTLTLFLDALPPILTENSTERLIRQKGYFFR